MATQTITSDINRLPSEQRLGSENRFIEGRYDLDRGNIRQVEPRYMETRPLSIDVSSEDRYRTSGYGERVIEKPVYIERPVYIEKPVYVERQVSSTVERPVSYTTSTISSDRYGYGYGPEYGTRYGAGYGAGYEQPQRAPRTGFFSKLLHPGGAKQQQQQPLPPASTTMGYGGYGPERGYPERGYGGYGTERGFGYPSTATAGYPTAGYPSTSTATAGYSSYYQPAEYCSSGYGIPHHERLLGYEYIGDRERLGWGAERGGYGGYPSSSMMPYYGRDFERGGYYGTSEWDRGYGRDFERGGYYEPERKSGYYSKLR